MIRLIWIACGGVTLTLALIGIVLPIMPTVPFLLLAAFCFARSSRRLYRWLLDHPTLGPPIRDWQQRGAISRPIKWYSTFSFVAAIGLAQLIQVPVEIAIAEAVILAGVAIFIWRRPDA